MYYYLRIAVDVGRYQQFYTSLLDRKYETVEEVHVDAGVALITSIFVALSRRIVELVFVSSHDDIFVGEFSEIDLRSGDLYLFY